MNSILDENNEFFERAYRACIDDFNAHKGVQYKTRVALHKAAILPDGSDSDESSSLRYFFDAFLSKACADRSFPVWKAKMPGDTLFEYRAIIDRLVSDIEYRRSFTLFDEIDKHVMDIYYDGDDEFMATAGAAGLSCVRAISVALEKFEFDEDATTENDTDPYQWDCAFMSSVALAGGAEWQADEGLTTLDPVARVAFWKWYVWEAIPAAYAEARERVR